MNTCGIKYMPILFANARVQVKDEKKYKTLTRYDDCKLLTDFWSPVTDFRNCLRPMKLSAPKILYVLLVVVQCDIRFMYECKPRNGEYVLCY